MDQMLARLVVVPLEFVEMGQLSQCITFIIYVWCIIYIYNYIYYIMCVYQGYTYPID